MTDQVTDTLLSIAQAFTLTSTPGANSGQFLFDLIGPPVDENGALSVVENVIQTVLKDAPVDLSFLLKDVRFKTAPIADQLPVGGLPILNILTPNLTESENIPPAAGDLPGVAGLISALKGTIPLPIQQTVENPLDVTFDVKWAVTDENGTAVSASELNWTLGANSGAGGAIPLQEGKDLAQLVLSFIPPIVELTSGLSLTIKRTVSVSICVTAKTGGGAIRATSGWINLPPIDIVLPVIPVPTIGFFFSQKFSGDLLIAAPGSSPLEQDTFMPALDTLNNILGTIDPLLQIGTTLLASLVTIKNGLATSKVVFRKGDGCDDLGDVEFAGASFFDWNGEDGDDHFASLVLIGPPNRRLECFNDSDFNSGEGQLNLTLDKELWVACWSLDSKHPGSNPAGAATVPVEPDGWNWGRARSIDKFENELSSYRFAWA